EHVGGDEVHDRSGGLPQPEEPQHLVFVGGERRVGPDEADREEIAPTRTQLGAAGSRGEEERDGEAAAQIDDERSVWPAGAESACECIADGEARYRAGRTAQRDEQDGTATPHARTLAERGARRARSCAEGLPSPSPHEPRGVPTRAGRTPGAPPTCRDRS